MHHTSDPSCPLCAQKLLLAHPYLQIWFHGQIKPKWPDAHVAWSYRDAVDQAQAVADGKSKVNYPDSAHNKTPAMALDLFQIDENNQGLWSPGFFNAVMSLGDPLIFWGGRFRHLGDMDHFEYRPSSTA